MLLFEIIGKRRNLDRNLPESQEWFPMCVWKNIDTENVGELMTVLGFEDDHRDTGERMMKTALWCVQYRPEWRPSMSVVVKMLEGASEIPAPSNPFAAFLTESNNVPSRTTWTDTSCGSESSSIVPRSTSIPATPVMKKYEIEMASTY
ncbi:protein SUPPRESSOR OF npr1-1, CONSTITUTIVE 1-like [Hibiscus syriacus]|uniref:Protein SUPPRESSOR OF npr1-1, CONSTITUTIVE 1-like n=1 Tax=Hibiscus syriacus TaxID=106335 RepID=A0A6A3BBC3_HIBSY|nr:protein SUPPRESSOR OF npr1-1, CONSTITUTIVE 1-like [Hibiscus syriacus]